MKTPPSRLLKVENRMRPKSPGTATTPAQAPLKSTAFGAPSAWTIVGSGMLISSRCPSVRTATAIDTSVTPPIPSQPIPSPETTPATSMVAPLTAPTAPLAFALSSEATRIVTHVDSARPRIIATIAPSRMRPVNSQNQALRGLASVSRGTRR